MASRLLWMSDTIPYRMGPRKITGLFDSVF